MTQQKPRIGSLDSLSVLCLLAASLWVWPTSSSAQFAGCNCGTVRLMHKDTQSHMTQETTQAAQQVIEALRAHSQQNSRYLDRQVEAAERISDAGSQNDALLARSKARAEAESGKFDPNPDFCLLIDTAIEAELPSNMDIPSAAAVADRAASWSRGEAEPIVVNGLTLAAFLARERDEIRSAGGAKDATTEWQMTFAKPTLDLTDTQIRQALPRLIANTIDPFPPIPLSDDDLRTPAGLSEAVLRRATEARNQAAISSIEYSLRLLSPSISSKPYQTIAERSRYDREIPDLISEQQALAIRGSAYYMPNAETLEIRHTKTERALLQDVLDLLSIQTRIAHLRLEQESRAAIVQAALLGLLTDGSTSNLRRP